MRRLLFGLAVLALAIACSDASAPMSGSQVPTSQLHFVMKAATAPPLLSDRDSFYAVLGEGREVRMYYQGAVPGDTGEEYLRFKVPNDGLLLRPDGTPFAPGDSILIVVKVIDPAKFVFDFAPMGLQFSPDHPAELSLKYNHGDHDYNSDGKIDTTDARIQTELDIWRRQPPDTLWYRLGSANYELLEELDAKIQHFTEHAIAW